MKRLLLGVTLLAIIFIAVVCKPVDVSDHEALLQDKSIETAEVLSNK